MLHNLEVKRLLCPMPVIRLGEKINQIKTGETIKMQASDPGVLHDIPAWCKVHGHDILSINQREDEIVIFVKKC
jgi:tRNA 2-thiouridine synthesizing protein A